MNEIDFLSFRHKKLHQLIVVSSNKDLISRDLDGEAVILNLESGKYFGLNEVGARIWSLLKESKSVKEILDTLLNEYDVEAERCEHELLTLLNDLSENGLIEIKDETGS